MIDSDLMQQLISAATDDGYTSSNQNGLELDQMFNSNTSETSLLSGSRLNESIESIFWPNTEVEEPDQLDLEWSTSTAEISSSAREDDGLLSSLFMNGHPPFLH